MYTFTFIPDIYTLVHVSLLALLQYLQTDQIQSDTLVFSCSIYKVMTANFYVF